MLKISKSNKIASYWLKPAIIYLFIPWYLLAASHAVFAQSFLNDIWAPQFQTFTVDDGLSQSTARIMLQDENEFVWITTPVGIDRFNGYEFESIPFVQTIERNPQQNVVALLTDHLNRIITVTRIGNIYRYEPTKGLFIPLHRSSLNLNVSHAQFLPDGNLYLITNQSTSIVNIEKDKAQIVEATVPELTRLGALQSVTIDGLNNFWFGTKKGELFTYTPNTKSTIQHTFNFSSALIVEKSTGDGVWIANQSGELFKAKLKEKIELEKINLTLPIETSNITALLQTDEHHLWVSTRGNGLFRIDLEQLSFRQFKLKNNFKGTLSSNNLYSLLLDGQGQLWAGASNGINVSLINNLRFYQIGGNSAYTQPLASPYVSSIYYNPSQGLWVGSNDSGLSHLISAQESSRDINGPTNTAFSLQKLPQPRSINALSIDKQGRYWVGGRTRLEWLNDELQALPIGEDWQYLRSNGIDSMLLFDEDKLIIDNNDQFSFQRENAPIYRYQIPSKEPVGSRRFQITGPYQDTYWFAAEDSGQIFQFNRLSQDISNLTPLTLEGQSLTGITSLWVSQNGELWAGTRSDGVFQLELNSGTFSWFNQQSNFPHSDTYSIIGDKNNNIWIAGNKGLSRFDRKTTTFQHFTERDGLQSNEFNHQAVFRSEDGLLFFGGINGLTVIDENQFALNSHIPKTYIQSATLFKNGQTTPLEIKKRRLEKLDYQSNSINFKIGAIDFLNPQSNQFFYRLIGQSNDWLALGNKRDVTFLKLSHGDYQLQVRSCNGEMTCNPNPASVSFAIPPPPWLSLWAYLIYFSLILATIVYYFKSYRDKLAYQRQIAQREKRVADELRELNRLKDEFLTNTSHELRTPLNGIIGLSELLSLEMVDEADNESKESLLAINNCGKQLKSLVDDLLDFSQLQNKRLILARENFDLKKAVEEIILLLKPLANRKKLSLALSKTGNNFHVNADNNRVRQVLYNLLNNAIKFTDTGVITITLLEKDNHVVISVKDQGIGIASEQQEKIFRSFTQVDGSQTRSQGGIGLGLSISKDIIELHGGELSLKSAPGRGSVFSFSLPLAAEPEPETAARLKGFQPAV